MSGGTRDGWEAVGGPWRYLLAAPVIIHFALILTVAIISFVCAIVVQ